MSPKSPADVILDEPLSIDGVVAVARRGARLVISPAARARIGASVAELDRLVREGRPIYGLTTGLGALDSMGVTATDWSRLQRHILRAHAAGVGEPLPDEHVRAMMASRANVLARGASGAHVEVIETLIAMLERDVVPLVPSRGSVGASDLAPLAHVALVVAGEGRARFEGELVAGNEAMARAGIALPELRDRDAVALINGLDATIATAALAVNDARRLVDVAEQAAAAAVVAWGGSPGFLEDRLADLKRHAGQRETAERLRALVAGMTTRADAGLRTPLSIRYATQIAGACRGALASAERVVSDALAGVVDNPVVTHDGFFTNDSPLTSGQELAETLHALSTALASLAVAGERRMALLLTPSLGSGLPPFLVHPDVEGGLNSGPIVAQYTAASLVAELRTRSAPASLQSIPTGAGTEDHVSMCWLEAMHASWVIDTVETVLALELIVSLQAIDVSGRPVPTGLAPLYEAVRAVVPVTTEDRVLGDDCARLLAALRA